MTRPTGRSLGFNPERPLVSAYTTAVDVLTGTPYEDVREGLGHANRVGASVMSDGVNPLVMTDSGPKRPIGSCDHVRVAGSSLKDYSTPLDYFPFRGDVFFRFNGGAPLINLPGVTALHDRDCPHPDVGLITDFAVKAINEMNSQWPVETSLLNYLLELREVPQLVNSLKSMRDALDNHGGNPDDPLKDIANAHLAYNFGFAPMLSDTTKLIKLWGVVEKRLEWLRRHYGRWTRVGSRSSFTMPERPNHGYWGPIIGPYLRIHGKEITGRFACTGYVRQTLPDLDSWLGFVRGVIGAGGLNRPLSVIWEAVPFSWLVDYFVPIGDYLSTIVWQDVVNWEISRVSWSWKATYRFLVQRIDTHGAGDGIAGYYALERYVRAQKFPPFQWYLRTPSAKQLLLSAALGATLS